MVGIHKKLLTALGKILLSISLYCPTFKLGLAFTRSKFSYPYWRCNRSKGNPVEGNQTGNSLKNQGMKTDRCAYAEGYKGKLGRGSQLQEITHPQLTLVFYPVFFTCSDQDGSCRPAKSYALHKKLTWCIVSPYSPAAGEHTPLISKVLWLLSPSMTCHVAECGACRSQHGKQPQPCCAFSRNVPSLWVFTYQAALTNNTLSKHNARLPSLWQSTGSLPNWKEKCCWGLCQARR